MKIDTGAQCNMLSMRTFKSLGLTQKLQPSDICIKAYGGSKLKGEGQITLDVKCKNRNYSTNFQVIDYPVPNILGANESEIIGMVRRVFAVVEDENPTEIMGHRPM